MKNLVTKLGCVLTLMVAAYMGNGMILKAQILNQPLPAVEVKDINGKAMNTGSLKNPGKPMVISFWATWCKPCIQELSAMHELYPDWQEETGVKIVAVSIDDSRSSNRVKPYANTKGWEFDILLDENQDFKRAMNVLNPPHTFLLDKDGKIVWQHNSYAPGDEEHLYQLLQTLNQGGSISQ